RSGPWNQRHGAQSSRDIDDLDPERMALRIDSRADVVSRELKQPFSPIPRSHVVAGPLRRPFRSDPPAPENPGRETQSLERLAGLANDGGDEPALGGGERVA